ncbi:BglG family transcription antiterminator [Pectinatus frisingensis]|uniref:BglG family transcription antiterminator n=1 Tax=Pectinatus frisingensis TaxID=865 RepID=UPI0018C6745E|nr:transcription antiterminator [Pectinatus frisingensis]
MEDLYNRQRLLIKYLLETDDFTPVKVFAKNLSCSDKTIRNDLNYWESRGITIEKIAGKGIKIADTQKYLVNDILNQKQGSSISTKERRMKILFELLEGKQMRLSIQGLSDKYFVSKTSIVNDLQMIETQIAPYDLNLHKDVKGTSLAGSETNIRRALVDMINQFVKTNETNLLNNYSRIDYDTLRELEQHFGQDNVKKVENMIEKIESFLDYKIIEPYYINLVTHILILIGRIQHNKTVFSEFNSDSPNYDSKFYIAAKSMRQYIENDFKVSLNSAETFYIYQYLTSSGGIGSVADSNNSLNDDVQTIAADIIEMSLKIYPLKFAFSQSLYKALLLHLRPMLNRINYKIYIKNPILDQVKSEFPEAMILLKLIMLKIQIKYELPMVSEDEIAYLAVYFQNAVEEIINKRNVVIVCSSGIGTSHLLKKRIAKYFPEWHIVDVISAKQIDNIIINKQIDLIIATVKLNIKTNIPIAYVSALFNETDAQNLRKSFMKQFPMPDNDKKDFSKGCFYKRNENVHTKKSIDNMCIAQCTITPYLHVTVYENSLMAKTRVEIYNTVISEGSYDKNINVYLPNKNELSEDVIKKIYYWILENK